ncbi:MAG: DUF4251 domain-containing protein [Flavobacteriaceae bacterium]|nr:DUF4251 domain-containing protein [Flavobacteriaceae bacterium]
MMKPLIFVLLVLMMTGCASTKKTHIVKEKDTKALDELISSKSFEINSQWAQPQLSNTMVQLGNAGLFPAGSNAGNINLIGNSNFLKMEGDRVQAFLPYYGERQMGGAYNNNKTGIEFDGIPIDLEITKEKKESYEINFNISDKYSPNEIYRVMIQIFPNLTSTITINSSQRFPIRYRGRAKIIEKNEEQI